MNTRPACPTSLAMNEGDLSRYLQHRLRDVSDLRVTGLKRFPRGVSRETWFVDLARSRGGVRDAQSLVIRRDPPGGSVCRSTLRFEYEVFRRLHGSEVPVANVLWYEDDPEWLIDGRELYVREMVDGAWEVPHFTDPSPEYDGVRIAAAKEHAAKLAALHRVNWRELGFGEVMEVPPTPQANARTAIDRLERELEKFQPEPLPVVTESLGWLRERAPKGARTVLLKGNNGIGEEIWRDGRIIAMSDWELASLGDPASDWAWCQGFRDIKVPGQWELRNLLDHYEQISGIHIEPKHIEFYKLMQALESVVASANAAVPVLNKQNMLARLSWVAIEPMQKGLENLARAAGILPPD